MDRYSVDPDGLRLAAGAQGNALLILTVYGCLLVLKGTLYLLWPPIGLRAMSLVSEANARKFAIAGVPLIAFGLLLGWDLLGSPTAPVAH
jgi:hypothetical protein